VEDGLKREYPYGYVDVPVVPAVPAILVGGGKGPVVAVLGSDENPPESANGTFCTVF